MGKFKLNRRELVIGGLATLGTAAAAATLWDQIRIHRSGNLTADYGAPSKIILGNSDTKIVKLHEGKRQFTARQAGSIVDFDLRTNQSRRLDIPLAPHGFCFSDKTDLICGVQKYGDQAVIAKRGELSLVKVLEAPTGISFSGHSQFIQDGKFLAITGEDNDSMNHIFLLDVAQDFKMLKSYETEFRIHEIRMLNDRHALLPIMRTTEGTRTGGLQLFDFETGLFTKVLESTAMSHILDLGDDRYITHGITGRKNELSVSLMDWKNQTVKSMSDSPDEIVHQLSGEALSSARLDANHAVLTAFDCKNVLVWNFETNRVATYSDEINHPEGVIMNGDGSFLINFDNKELRRFRFDSVNHKIEPLETIFSTVGNGRHLYVFNDAKTR